MVKTTDTLTNKLAYTLGVMRKARLSATPMVVWLADINNVEAALAELRNRPVARDTVIEECIGRLQASYPSHAWLNAACATLRMLARTEKA